MPEPAQEFYDNLACNYHLMFEDWEASIERQAAVLAPIVERECGAGVRVLDCSCGIGTQMLGLAQRGFHLTGSDGSAAAIARARKEAAGRGLDLRFFIADMRDLAGVPGTFDAVISMDNALPHLENDTAWQRALAAVRSKLRPGGVFLASIRDYDCLVRERPVVHGPAFFSDDGRRRIVFQLWDWMDERRYRFHLYITRELERGWETLHGSSTYRAVLREEVSGMLHSAGFAEVRWLMPADCGYYQPIVVARVQ
jgi:glycine/sarcosine N-methyltransferase